ncbi:hypothetical protein NOU10_00100 [Ligilactobacillus sp. MP3]|uniref:hypothetical protein n=1 Tax=Ligilactobacillus sp. MP3 TaxID=2965103 RepID=UPI0021087729|nr:hypothetical protein [Ligilactobacillus sp. MP3]MCQ4115790.1 hypothetical protein [Ligilactobacillus sp. MP3]
MTKETTDKMKKQVAYNKKWYEKNREHKRYLSKRSTARSFLRVATKEDIESIIEFANEQLKERF